jgi:hypothetical protein
MEFSNRWNGSPARNALTAAMHSRNSSLLPVASFSLQCSLISAFKMSTASLAWNQNKLVHKECRLLGCDTVWVITWHFRGTCCLHLQGRSSQSVSYRLTLFFARVLSSTLEIEATLRFIINPHNATSQKTAWKPQILQTRTQFLIAFLWIWNTITYILIYCFKLSE